MKNVKRLLACLLFVCATTGYTAEAEPMAAAPALEARLVVIADELRCLVCQNESLAASRAELAIDLRREIRGMLRDGKSDQEILDFMVARYGDFVRYRPPLKPSTVLLWGGPFVLLLAGIGGLFYTLRRRAKDLPDEEEDEEAV